MGRRKAVRLLPAALVAVAHLAPLAQAARAAAKVVHLLPVVPPRQAMGETPGPRALANAA